MEVDSFPEAAASTSRPKRKSEPPHVTHPERRTQESWEYPMSKEEKKDRVIFLFEQELSEARQNEEEQAMDELYTHLERIEELRPGTAKRLKAAVRSIGLLEVDAGSKSSWLTSWKGSRSLKGWLLAGFLTLLAISAMPFVYWRWSGASRSSAPEAVTAGAANVSAPQPPLQGSDVGVMGMPRLEPGEGSTIPAVVVPPTTATTTAMVTTTAAPAPVAPARVAPATMDATTLDTVNRLRRVGNDQLERSDCYQAAHYFNVSRQVLSTLEANVTEEIRGLHFSLLNDHAFALICSRRFREGIALLDGCLTGTLKCPSYLLNALGYAFFELQDMNKSADVFQMGIAEDMENPIIWNNLGAARMELGDLVAADDALDKAAAIAEKNSQSHPRELAITNVRELTSRVRSGKVRQKAKVDIWFTEKVTEWPSTQTSTRQKTPEEL